MRSPEQSTQFSTTDAPEIRKAWTAQFFGECIGRIKEAVHVMFIFESCSCMLRYVVYVTSSIFQTTANTNVLDCEHPLC
jgi:hypothetical protein